MKTRENELHEPIITKNGEWRSAHCSVCGEEVASVVDYYDRQDNTVIMAFLPNYCANCGARLKEIEE